LAALPASWINRALLDARVSAFAGSELAEIASEDGVLTAAYKSRVRFSVPVSPTAESRWALPVPVLRKEQLQFDIVQDVLDMAQIAIPRAGLRRDQYRRRHHQSFLRQTEMSARTLKQQIHGHKYAIQFAADAPHPGGRSSAVSFDESLVYGKLGRGALTAYVNCDATIALPILITALSQTAAKYMKGRRRPNFTFAGKDLIIDVP
jgi:deoxyhypusine synthase